MFKGFITSCYVLFAMSINLGLKNINRVQLKSVFRAWEGK